MEYIIYLGPVTITITCILFVYVRDKNSEKRKIKFDMKNKL